MTRGLAKSAGLIGLATLSSRILGLVRDTVTAYFFGTSAQFAAFTVATRVPALLRELFAEGAMSAAFVPTLTRKLEKDGKQEAWRLASNVINGLILVTGVLTLLGIIFAKPLVTLLVAEKYELTPGQLELTMQLARINLPFLMLIAVAAACMGILNALRRFLVPALSPATFNVVFIASAAILVPLFRKLGVSDIHALSIGMLGGGLAQILVQLPLLRREGYRHRWILNFNDPGFRQVLVLMGPGTLGVAAAQINLLVNTSLATSDLQAPGALRYAFQLMYLPIGIFGVSVATATIPDLARQAGAQAFSEMGKTVSWAVRLMLVLSIPSIVGLIVLAHPIIQMVLERGAFDPVSTAMTAPALAFYAPGILGYSLVKIASPSFYSMQEARTPVIISVVTIAVNLVLNIWLNSLMGYRGLALGTALAANVNAGLLLIVLSKRLSSLEGSKILQTFIKTAIASAIMGVAAYYAHAGLAHTIGDARLWQRAINVFGAIGTGVGVFAVAAHVLHVEEFRAAMTRVLALRSRFQR
jgi:putative peptidoglycan lipid II flippase